MSETAQWLGVMIQTFGLGLEFAAIIVGLSPPLWAVGFVVWLTGFVVLMGATV
jgi:hypothetical protein